MGLLDFISKTSTTQGGQVDPAASNTQSGSQLSDVQYPIPSVAAGDGAGNPTSNSQPATDYSQYTYNPAAAQATDLGQTDDVADITQDVNSDFYNQKMQDVEDLTQYSTQPSVATPPYPQQNDQILPQVTDNNVAVPQYDVINSYQATPEMQSTPASSDTSSPVLPEQVQPITPLPEVSVAPASEVNNQVTINNPFNSTTPTDDTLPSLENLEAQSNALS